MRSILVTFSTLLLAAPALAQDTAPAPMEPPPAEPAPGTATTPAPPPAAAPADDSFGFLVGLKAGGFLAKPFSDLGPALTPELEIGYFVMERKLAVFIDVGYLQPKASGTVVDNRVPDGSYKWNLTQRDLTTSLGAIFRFTAVTPVIPYAGAALRMHLLESVIKGTAGTGTPTPLGESRETRTKVGGVLLGGVELSAGPGYLLGELEIGYAGLDNRVTGVANMGGTALRIGYRIMF